MIILDNLTLLIYMLHKCLFVISTMEGQNFNWLDFWIMKIVVVEYYVFCRERHAL